MTTLKTLILNLLLIASLIGFDRLLSVDDGRAVAAQPLREAAQEEPALAARSCLAAHCPGAVVVIDSVRGPVYATLLDDATPLN